MKPTKVLLCLSARCGHRWKSANANTACTKCGHLYVQWINYDDWTIAILRRET